MQIKGIEFGVREMSDIGSLKRVSVREGGEEIGRAREG